MLSTVSSPQVKSAILFDAKHASLLRELCILAQIVLADLFRPVNSDRDLLKKNVQDLARHYDRLWLVAIRPWETDPEGDVKATLDQSLKSLREVALPGVGISSYIGKLPS